MKEEEEAVGGVPLEVALWEGVALGEGEGEEVGTSPVAEESLIHVEWGSVLACVNIYVILTAISKKAKSNLGPFRQDKEKKNYKLHKQHTHQHLIT